MMPVFNCEGQECNLLSRACSLMLGGERLGAFGLEGMGCVGPLHDGVCGSPCRWSWMVTAWHFTSLMVLKVRNFYDLHTTGHTDSAVLLYEQSLKQLCPVASQIILYDTTFS